MENDGESFLSEAEEADSRDTNRSVLITQVCSLSDWNPFCPGVKRFRGAERRKFVLLTLTRRLVVMRLEKWWKFFLPGSWEALTLANLENRHQAAGLISNVSYYEYFVSVSGSDVTGSETWNWLKWLQIHSLLFCSDILCNLLHTQQKWCLDMQWL